MCELNNNLSINKNNNDEISEEICKDEEIQNSSRWRSNMFCIYSKVFKIILSNWRTLTDYVEEEELLKELDQLILPSDEEWRHHVYYRLVDLQREIDSGDGEEGNEIELDIEDIYDDPTRDYETRESPFVSNINEWEPINRDVSNKIDTPSLDATQHIVTRSTNVNSSYLFTNYSMTDVHIEPGWRLKDIVLAANVLQGNETASSAYSDEAEMRRVYGLVYDVLRYKEILNKTLENADFWTSHSELHDRERIVWLLLYDMQGRKFKNHTQVAIIQMRNQQFNEAGLNDIEEALLNSKTKLAASISRLRIGGAALTLGLEVDKLLPQHLRNEGISWSDNDAVASGWVNTIKIPSKSAFINQMSSLGLNLISNSRKLCENNYAFDPICPKVVILHEKAREQLARSDLVREYGFIFLDRSLCLGAAALARTIRIARLCGPVILTHSMAPRHTGYLAGLLFDIEDAGRLLAFGAGSSRIEYESYLENLGIGEKICRVFAENYSQAPEFAEMERATVILATPPCSYTGLKDIVDLAVARGGDTKLLESLTNIDAQSQLNRPRNLLIEQMSSLKYALTRPNVQLLMYEAHSILPSETVQMLEQLVYYANKMAVEKYIREFSPKRKGPSKDLNHKSGQSSKPSAKHALQDTRAKSFNEDNVDDNTMAVQQEIEVPNSDLFEIGNIFDFHDKESKTTDPMIDDGCYLAIVRRKEMMQFNSLFMIKVAEAKGLFGDPNLKPREHDQQSKDEHSTMTSPMKNKKDPLKINSNRRKKSLTLDRITASTHSSLLKIGSRTNSRQYNDNDSSAAISVTSIRVSCPRYSDRIAKKKRSINVQVCETRRRDIRSWWEQSANFLIHAARCESCKFHIFHTDPWTKRAIYPPKVQQIYFSNDNIAYQR